MLAGDAPDGWRRRGLDRPDLIALDNELPGPSGLELVSRIRQAEATGTHTPIVLLGGASNDYRSAISALNSGARGQRGALVYAPA